MSDIDEGGSAWEAVDRFDLARDQTTEALGCVVAELTAKRAERAAINERIRVLVEQEETLRSAVRVLTRRRTPARPVEEDDQP